MVCQWVCGLGRAQRSEKAFARLCTGKCTLQLPGSTGGELAKAYFLRTRFRNRGRPCLAGSCQNGGARGGSAHRNATCLRPIRIVPVSAALLLPPLATHPADDKQKGDWRAPVPRWSGPRVLGLRSRYPLAHPPDALSPLR